jgi:pyrroloquinoline quinone biosynthesis protein B
MQIESTSALWPEAARGSRNTAIRGVILTGAELDQVLGLLLLREFQPLTVYATSVVRQILEANSFFRMLERIPQQLTWVTIRPGEPLLLADGLRCTPIALPGSLPFYAQLDCPDSQEANLGLVLEGNGHRLTYTPSLPAITPELLELYEGSDAIFVDGTFWSDTELSNMQPGAPTARAIGHLPMSGPEGSMAGLAGVKRPTLKMYVHVNNTNPVLDREGSEYRAMMEAGWRLAEDGWEWESA